jgi:hypothetical protein
MESKCFLDFSRAGVGAEFKGTKNEEDEEGSWGGTVDSALEVTGEGATSEMGDRGCSRRAC